MKKSVLKDKVETLEYSVKARDRVIIEKDASIEKLKGKINALKSLCSDMANTEDKMERTMLLFKSYL